MLGLSIGSDYRWKLDSLVTKVDNGDMTRRQVHSLIGELLGNFPVGKMGLNCNDKVGQKIMEILLRLSST